MIYFRTITADAYQGPNLANYFADTLKVKQDVRSGRQRRLRGIATAKPSDYSITAYGGALVVIDAIERLAKSGQPVNRANVRDAIQTTHVKTLQGMVSFDTNGDIAQRVVPVFQVKHDPNYPVDDLVHQYQVRRRRPARQRVPGATSRQSPRRRHRHPAASRARLAVPRRRTGQRQTRPTPPGSAPRRDLMPGSTLRTSDFFLLARC